MKILEFFPVDIIGYWLLHSLWQGLIITSLVYLCFWLFKINRPSNKYNVAIIGLGLFTLTSLSTLLIFFKDSMFSNVNNLGHSLETSMIQTIWSDLPATLQINTHFYLPWFVTGWLVGVLLLSLRLLGGYIYIQRLKNKAIEKISPELKNYVNQIADKLSLKKTVDIKFSALLDVPVVVGFVKPVILVPLTFTSGLAQDQIECIIAHELAHIKRHDYLINIVQSIVEVLFFFNPFIWILSSIIREEREKACDDVAVSISGHRRAYAKALAQLELSNTQHQVVVALASGKNQIIVRMKRLLGMKTQNTFDLRLLTLVVLSVCMMGFSWYNYHKQQFVEPELTQEKQLSQYVDLAEEVTNNAYAPLPDFTEESYAPEPVSVPSSDIKNSDYGHAAQPVDTIVDPELQKWKREFHEKFKQKFGEFYNENQNELNQLLNELPPLPPIPPLPEFDEASRLALMEERSLLDSHRKAELEQRMALLENERLERKQQMKQLEENMHEAREEMRQRRSEMRQLNLKFKAYEKELLEELVSDGYITEGDDPIDLEFDDDGDYVINGQKVSPKHKEKYQKIHEKHFGEKPGHFRLKY